LHKRWLIVPGLLVAALILTMMAFDAPEARADNGPHVQGWGSTPDGCAACHRVHRGIDEYLLLDEVETLCLQCHDTGALGSNLDVEGGSDEGMGGALRAGGFGSARINTADPSLPIPRFPTGSSSSADNDTGVSICYQNGVDDDSDGVIDDGCRPLIGVLAAPGGTTQSSHSVDGSPQTVWGNGPVNATPVAGLVNYDLTCGSCHDPHGNGNYRILRSIPSGSGAPTPGYAIPDTSYPKNQAAGDYTTDNYFDMTFTGSELTDNILTDTSAWCSQCHTRYLASRRDPTPANKAREDSGDAIFRYRHSSSGFGYSSTPGGAATPNNRACITCHAAHGSNSTAGTYSGAVPNPDGVVVTPSAPNNRLLKMNNRGMCQKCHNQ
jgi:predicted CXXCH cytochrome family protein